MSGGWDVTAVHDGRVVVTRHCADWHRAERARRLLTFELQTHRGGLAAAALVLAVLSGALLGAPGARGEPELAGTPTPAARTAAAPAAADPAGFLPDCG
jgi:hypothetical protein